MAGKKNRRLDIPMDDELFEQVADYAEEKEVSAAALGRALLRWFTNREDPRPLPPGIEDENKRPSRRKSNVDPEE